MGKPLRDRRLRRTAIWLALALALVVWRGQEQGFDLGAILGLERNPGTIEALHAARRSDVVVELEGRVARLLADDREGSPHQRFIVELESGHTVLIAHNIDLAPRVPVERGERVAVRGEYEWNEQGGVVHWTHHDPKGRRPGGWIRHDGRMYR